ncbi:MULTISPECIES: hypothetical protein [unclassified Streptomyces]|uniref:hypothetical protein n=1 Tax=unclassified Streptomyces TaxID=2593676 RepID=UPI002DDBCBDD|nr:hypothetical protein [Streptomyces sp. NBC_01445]WSE11290.1 hypothetical protein OG574_49475 [Streptomyces sp. NBC_01445]
MPRAPPATLDSRGFDDVRFTSRYPVGTVDFADGAAPVSVRLNAYSPVRPAVGGRLLALAGGPGVRVHQHPSAALDAELALYAENPVVLGARTTRPVVLKAADFGEADLVGVEFTAELGVATPPGLREDVLLEDWSDGYDGWTTTGTAFGDRPVRLSDIPDYATGVDPRVLHLSFGCWSHQRECEGPGAWFRRRRCAVGRAASGATAPVRAVATRDSGQVVKRGN